MAMCVTDLVRVNVLKRLGLAGAGRTRAERLTALTAKTIQRVASEVIRTCADQVKRREWWLASKPTQ